MNAPGLNKEFHQQLFLLGIPRLPEFVVDSAGMPMDVSGDVWYFNTPIMSTAYGFARMKILNPWLEYSLKRYAIFCVQRVSPMSAYNALRRVVLHLRKAGSWNKLATEADIQLQEHLLHSTMSSALEWLRANGCLHNFNDLRAWYCWCADYLPDFGFNDDVAYKWEQMRIPGMKKGIAVRTNDPECGPLDDAEQILIRQALLADTSGEPHHVQQRAALWLSLAFGRNPRNVTLARRSDFFQVKDALPDEIWILRMPRIKKSTGPRATFKELYVDASLAAILNDLISQGPQPVGAEPEETPLFVRSGVRDMVSRSLSKEWFWHMTTDEFTSLLSDAIRRYAIKSPRTGQPLRITTRRLRYTFATNLVREGIGALDLAEALDHSDLQHVQVYFDAKSTVVERLDKASATQIGPILQLFKGQIVKGPDHATNGWQIEKRIRIIPELIPADHHMRDLGSCGKNEFCSLHPPYSCYPCDRFEPFSDSIEVHEQILGFLIDRRERLRTDPLNNSRIAVQLDEVIYACAEVVEKMKLGGTN